MSSHPPEHNEPQDDGRIEAAEIVSMRILDLLDELDPHPATRVGPTPYRAYMDRFTNRVMVEVRRLESEASHTDLPNTVAESLSRETPGMLPGSAFNYFQTFAKRLWGTISDSDASSEPPPWLVQALGRTHGPNPRPPDLYFKSFISKILYRIETDRSFPGWLAQALHTESERASESYFDLFPNRVLERIQHTTSESDTVDGPPDLETPSGGTEAPSVIPLPSARNRNNIYWAAAAVVLLLISISLLWFRPFASNPDQMMRTFAMSRTTTNSLGGFSPDQILEFYRPFFRQHMNLTALEESTFVDLYRVYLQDLNQLDEVEDRLQSELAAHSESTESAFIAPESVERLFEIDRQRTERTAQLFEALETQMGFQKATAWLLFERRLREDPIPEFEPGDPINP